MTQQDAMRVLTDGEYGVLATYGADGYPYGVPVNYVFDGEKIYFHCAKDAGHKQENLDYCSRVSFTVVAEHRVAAEKFTEKYRSAVVFGAARKITDEAAVKAALLKLVEKYSADYMETGRRSIEASCAKTDIYEISVEDICGKANR